ncbi:glycoside hydrolase family 28 protein [Neptunicella marina]|uniref:Polygalacturonase n=1 Tax=Neptunicella marina TaxID=2125989 RepID=A0A8J6IX22_9ALTE|nr:glycosyl hydrolase family 28 protein [Neptunicella marina]MBC3767599.1 polygalacturonase [Neptunicella marina]
MKQRMNLCILLSLFILLNSSLAFAAETPDFEHLDSLLPTEPKLPKNVCEQLSANLVAHNWRLADEIDNDPKNSSPDSQRIQTALDNCAAGSAVKLVTNEKNNAFLSGPLSIPSGVTLWVDKNVTLFASRSPADYDLGDGICGDALPKIKNRCQTWITATDTVNSGIVGEGALDGRGGSVLTSGKRAFKSTWWDLSMQSKAKVKLEQNNPRMLHVDGGKNFTLYKISLFNSPKFHFGSNDVDGITVWGIKLVTPSLAYANPDYQCDENDLPRPGKLDQPSRCFIPELVKNTDGIDPGTSTNVTLAYSFITTGDDNVAIKSGGKNKQSPASRHHLYAHNHFYYGHGMSIGSETDAGVHDIKIWDLVVDGNDSGHGVGLRIKSDGKRGGNVTNVTYDGVCMRRVKEPLVFSPYYSSTKSTKLPPSMQNITVRNFNYVDYPKAKYNKTVINLSGYKTDKLINPLGLTLDNVVFPRQPRVRDKHHHNIHFTLGKGQVVNFPLLGTDTNSVTDLRDPSLTGQAPYSCDDKFKAFPSPASPI